MQKVTEWLLKGDPSIRWQVLRDLAGAPESIVLEGAAVVGGLGAVGAGERRRTGAGVRELDGGFDPDGGVVKIVRHPNVVMQSTGVNWIAVYDVLEKAGFQVCLANARDTKNLPGRKTEVQESPWLLKLHSYGLLRNSFRQRRKFACCEPRGGCASGTCGKRRAKFSTCRRR